MAEKWNRGVDGTTKAAGAFQTEENREHSSDSTGGREAGTSEQEAMKSAAEASMENEE